MLLFSGVVKYVPLHASILDMGFSYRLLTRSGAPNTMQDLEDNNDTLLVGSLCIQIMCYDHRPQK